MYNTQFLINALDNVIASAASRLTEPELNLLHLIRDGFTNYKCEQNQQARDEKIEKDFVSLVNFILLIKEYIDHFL